MSAPSAPRGSFSEGELSLISGLAPGISGPDEAARFVQHCVDYYLRWYDINAQLVLSGAIPQEQAALFLYAQVPEVSSGLPGIDAGMLKRAHPATCTMATGVFVCSETLSSSWRAPCDVSKDDDLMDFVLANLRDDQTFVILHMARRMLYVHHAGVKIQDWRNGPTAVNVSVNNNAVDLDSVDQQLTNYHQDHTSTHLGYTARLMWKTEEGARPTLHHKPEQHVQTSLLTHLKAWFRYTNVIVQEEIGNSGGRVDIQISRVSGGQMIKSTLELKILKPDKSDDWNLDWGRRGISQAKDYINHETDFSMTCLYDARLDKSDPLNGLPHYADECKVKLRFYPMTPPNWNKTKRSRSAARGC